MFLEDFCLLFLFLIWDITDIKIVQVSETLWAVFFKTLPSLHHRSCDVVRIWPPHAKSWLTGKNSNAGRDWGQEETGTTKDEMAGWHHGLDGRESEWTLGVGDGQGGLECCNSRGCKESDTTEQLNWTELNAVFCLIFYKAPAPKIISDEHLQGVHI